MFNYQNQDKIFPACPICGGTQFRQLASNDRYDMGIKTTGCLRCGLVQTRPRLTSQSMSHFYRECYRQYYQAVNAPHVDYIICYHKDERLAYTAKLIASNVDLVAGMRVLDVGCAEGTLFSNLKTHCGEGLIFFGVEPSESYAAYSREMTGCTTYQNIDELISAREDSFHLIVVNHVLEHVNDPVLFLEQLRGLLSSNGLLFVDVPNVFGYSSPRDLHIAHNFHFSRQTLTAAIDKAGFSVKTIAEHAPPHHPVSVWCLAEKRTTKLHILQQSMETELVAWKRMQWINKLIPLYLLKVRIRRNRIVSLILENRCRVFLTGLKRKKH